MKSMLCSDCNKNAAILFFDKVQNGKSTMEEVKEELKLRINEYFTELVN